MAQSCPWLLPRSQSASPRGRIAAEAGKNLHRSFERVITSTLRNLLLNPELGQNKIAECRRFRVISTLTDTLMQRLPLRWVVHPMSFSKSDWRCNEHKSKDNDSFAGTSRRSARRTTHRGTSPCWCPCRSHRTLQRWHLLYRREQTGRLPWSSGSEGLVWSSGRKREVRSCFRRDFNTCRSTCRTCGEVEPCPRFYRKFGFGACPSRACN